MKTHGFQRIEMDFMRIEGKTVLITGAAKRIGAEFARAFATAGAAVIIHCRRSRPEAEALAATLPGAGLHRVLEADLAHPGAAEKLFAAAGRVDILVNNASLYCRSELAVAAPELDREHFEVNFWSPLELMRCFAAQPGLSEGAVINLVDQEALQVSPHGGAYALSRRALIDATLELARELGPRHLRFNAVAPGPVLPPVGLEHSKMEKTLPTVPLRRRVEPADLAAAVLFLAANDSITGAVLPVDGGQHL